MPDTLLGAALDAAGRGWPVFPLRPGTKIPALHGHDACPATGPCTSGHLGWEQRATCDPDRVRHTWATGPYNVGLATGPAGLVVVDLDMPKPTRPTSGAMTLTTILRESGHHLPPCRYVGTPSRGAHLYFAHPTTGPQLRNTAGKLGPGIDTRAHGGYVLAAGSILANGAYTVHHHGDEVPALPGWLADRLAPAPAPLPASRPVVVNIGAGRRTGWLNAAITRQLGYLTSAPDGQRNQALYISAVALGQLAAGGALTDNDVYDLLTQACLSAGLRPKPSTIASGLRAGKARPRSVAA